MCEATLKMNRNQIGFLIPWANVDFQNYLGVPSGFPSLERGIEEIRTFSYLLLLPKHLHVPITVLPTHNEHDMQRLRPVPDAGRKPGACHGWPRRWTATCSGWSLGGDGLLCQVSGWGRSSRLGVRRRSCRQGMPTERRGCSSAAARAKERKRMVAAFPAAAAEEFASCPSLQSWPDDDDGDLR